MHQSLVDSNLKLFYLHEKYESMIIQTFNMTNFVAEKINIKPSSIAVHRILHRHSGQYTFVDRLNRTIETKQYRQNRCSQGSHFVGKQNTSRHIEHCKSVNNSSSFAFISFLNFDYRWSIKFVKNNLLISKFKI